MEALIKVRAADRSMRFGRLERVASTAGCDFATEPRRRLAMF